MFCIFDIFSSVGFSAADLSIQAVQMASVCVSVNRDVVNRTHWIMDRPTETYNIACGGLLMKSYHKP